MGEGSRAHLVAVPTRWADGALVAAAGRSSREHARARPEVTMVFPPPDGAGMSLIVDGRATVDGDDVVVTPTWAVRHRSALR